MAGGMLSITAGMFDLFVATGLVIDVLVTGTANIFTAAEISPLTMQTFTALIKVLAVYLAVVGMLAVVGGMFAVQRKNWGLAMAGSIAALVSFGGAVLGIPAVVFTAISRREFS
jgi:hypothetical protein